MTDTPTPSPDGKLARRTLLIGAASASAVVSIRPALAQTQASIMTCEIPIPDRARAGQLIAADGQVVAPGTPGAFPGANRPFTGEQVKAAMKGQNLPGADGDTTRAYLKYVQRLQNGTSGFTCFASLQMPRG